MRNCTISAKNINQKLWRLNIELLQQETQAVVSPSPSERVGGEVNKKGKYISVISFSALQDGLEPTTPWLTVRCSNQLSYWSISANPLFDCECKSTTFFLFHQTFWGKFFISCKNTVIFSLCCCFLLIIYYFCPKKKELLWS